MVTLRDIQEARARIEGMVLRTPLLGDPTGSNLRLKAEHLQRTGSFKLRGASHRVTRAVQEEGARHVVTASSGNHGQAVAYVARALGIKATIVVPVDAAPVKVRAIREFG